MSTLGGAFGCLQWEMPGSVLPAFRFSASRYDSFQGRYLNSNCAIKCFFSAQNIQGGYWANLDTPKLEKYEMY